MVVTLDQITFQIKNVCSNCHGIPDTRCLVCRGTGKTYKEISLLDLKQLLDGYGG